jgi:transcription elongation factor GreA
VSIADQGGIDSITREGHARLSAELKVLLTDGRRELLERLRDVREDGADASDNAGLADVLEEQSRLERRIADIRSTLATARIAEPLVDGTAGIGARVTVRTATGGRTLQYELVGAQEADLSAGRLSIASPVGQALLGRAAGDVVEVEAPAGKLSMEIVSVEDSGGFDASVAVA